MFGLVRFKRFHVRTATFFLMIVVLACTPVSQPTPSHWLVGRWDGEIEGYSSNQGPARTLRIIAVSPDSGTPATWNVTGQRVARAEAQFEGSQVKIVTGVKSVVELRLAGGQLAGWNVYASNRAGISA